MYVVLRRSLPEKGKKVLIKRQNISFVSTHDIICVMCSNLLQLSDVPWILGIFVFADEENMYSSEGKDHFLPAIIRRLLTQD